MDRNSLDLSDSFDFDEFINFPSEIEGEYANGWEIFFTR